MNVSHYLEAGTFCSFWDDPYEDSFRVGYFLAGDDSFSLFALITTRGYDDGFYFTSNENIFRVTTEDSYTQRIKRLFDIQNQKAKNIPASLQELNFSAFLKFAKQEHAMISVFAADEASFCGYVKNIECGELELLLINDDGLDDGIVFMSLASIMKARADSGEERLRTQLRCKNKL